MKSIIGILVVLVAVELVAADLYGTLEFTYSALSPVTRTNLAALGRHLSRGDGLDDVADAIVHQLAAREKDMVEHLGYGLRDGSLDSDDVSESFKQLYERTTVDSCREVDSELGHIDRSDIKLKRCNEYLRYYIKMMEFCEQILNYEDYLADLASEKFVFYVETRFADRY